MGVCQSRDRLNSNEPSSVDGQETVTVPGVFKWGICTVAHTDSVQYLQVSNCLKLSYGSTVLKYLQCIIGETRNTHCPAVVMANAGKLQVQYLPYSS